MTATALRREVADLSRRIHNRQAPTLGSAVETARTAGFEPDAWQEAILRSRAKRILINASRQSGKSTTTSVLATHTALSERQALVLLVSPSLRQSQEIFRKALTVYRDLGRPISPQAENALSLELENGSRVVSLPGSEATVRGFSSAALVILDEAARIPDELWHAVSPMVAVSGGRVIAMSTPWGKRGWWYGLWTEGDAWQRVEVPATECPRIPADFLEQERKTLPAFVFEAEYLCQFHDDVSQYFGSALVDAALCDDAPLFATGVA